MIGSPSCSRCGAPVPIAGLEPARCRHCGGEPSLDASSRGRIDALRHRIASADASAQQLDGALHGFGRGVGLFEVGTAGLLWGVLGGLLTLGAAGNLRDDQTFTGVLFDPPVDADASFAASTFWMAFLTVLGFSVCCAMAGIARLAARRQVRFTYPAPPSIAGGPPGCRVCGGDLDAPGAVRRCLYCKADNIVDGVHFQQVEDHLGARLAAREHAVGETLASRQRAIKWLDKLVMGPPFATLLLFPVVFFLGQPDVAWWLLPVGLLTVALLLFVVASRVADARAHGQ